jgi:hypothetical protein
LLCVGYEGETAECPEIVTMHAKVFAAVGRSQEAAELLFTTPTSVPEGDRSLVQALIYRAENKLGNGQQNFWSDYLYICLLF